MPISQMTIVRLREVKSFAQGNTPGAAGTRV